MLLKELIFFIGKLNLLSMKDTSELLSWDLTFSKEIVILEEFTKSDSIFLNLNLYLKEKIINVFFTLESLSHTEVSLLWPT